MVDDLHNRNKDKSRLYGFVETTYKWIRFTAWAKVRPVAYSSSFWTAAATVAIAVTSVYQWKAIRGQLDVMRNQLELSERPWVDFDIVVNGPLVFSSTDATMRVRITLKNVGNSPATELWFSEETLAAPPSNPMAERERFCRELKGQEATNKSFTDTLFVKRDSQNDVGLQMNKSDVDAAVKKIGVIMPTVIACVVYRTPSTRALHETAKILDIVAILSTGRVGVINPKETNVFRASKIAIVPHAIGATYAD